MAQRRCLFPGSQALVTVPPVLPASLWAAPRPPAPVGEQSVCRGWAEPAMPQCASFCRAPPPPASLPWGSPWLPSEASGSAGSREVLWGESRWGGTSSPSSLQGSRSPDIVFHPWKKEENGDQSRLILYTINLTNPLAPKTATVRETQVRGQLAASVLRGRVKPDVQEFRGAGASPGNAACRELR